MRVIYPKVEEHQAQQAHLNLPPASQAKGFLVTHVPGLTPGATFFRPLQGLVDSLSPLNDGTVVGSLHLLSRTLNV
jgi:hypothetical protein